MRVGDKEMNLAQYVEHRKAEATSAIEQKYWEDEGLVWAIQDYESSCPYADWSEEDRKYLEDNNLEELIDLFNIED